MSKKDKKNITWQKLFLSKFKKGDEVIIVTEDDRFDWGRLDWNSVEVILFKIADKGHGYSWNKIAFICDAGFPVRKLHGADGSSSIIKNSTASIAKSVRDALEDINEEKDERRNRLSYGLSDLRAKADGLFPTLCEKLKELEKHVPERVYPHRIGFHDPFEIEASGVKLYNCGNSGYAFWNSPFIETLLIHGPDGSKAFLWDLGSVFFAE